MPSTIPLAIREHVVICLDNQLFPHAFSLLTAALPALPPPSHLRVALTLALHPRWTTRTTDPDRLAASHAARHYLHTLAALPSAPPALWLPALRFAHPHASSSRRKCPRARRSPERDADADADPDADEPPLRCSYAGSASLSARADDLWALVGWALNCAVLHPARWAVWRPWLDSVLGVMEADFAARLPAAGALDARDALADSLLAHHLAAAGDGRSNYRRIMRALLAAGTPTALAEFGAIWKDETLAPASTSTSTHPARRNVDVANGDFGDYFDDDDEDEDPDSTAPSPHPPASPSHDAQGPPGGPAALHLRHRLLRLLTRFSALHPVGFLALDDLFDLYTEFLRPLPLPLFTALVQPPRAYLDPAHHQHLMQNLLRPLLPCVPPGAPGAPLTPALFAAHYAPQPAAALAAADHARVSLCLEALLRGLWRASPQELQELPALRPAVEAGIAARAAKARPDARARRGPRADDVEAVRALGASAERMRVVLELVDGDGV